jgi:hypothetical protein
MIYIIKIKNICEVTVEIVWGNIIQANLQLIENIIQQQ